MPKQKDLKRLTRARMEKTGESYTAARATLLAKEERRAARRTSAAVEAAPPAPPAATTPIDYAALAGMSDETIRARTGRDWKGWVDALDDNGAAKMPHREIAQLVSDEFGTPSWWAQTVTVGYERIKGLREIGQQRNGAYEAAKSKTVAAPLAEVRRAFTDGRTRGRWLPGVQPTVRENASVQSIRIAWEDGTAVDVWLTAKGEAKTQVAIAHRKLASRDDVEARKAFWGERLAALADLLAAAPAGGRS